MVPRLIQEEKYTGKRGEDGQFSVAFGGLGVSGGYKSKGFKKAVEHKSRVQEKSLGTQIWKSSFLSMGYPQSLCVPTCEKVNRARTESWSAPMNKGRQSDTGPTVSSVEGKPGKKGETNKTERKLEEKKGHLRQWSEVRKVVRSQLSRRNARKSQWH